MKFTATSGKIIYSCPSEDYIIEVRENGKYRWLHFGDNAIQSAMLIANPSSIVLPYLLPLLAGIEVFSPSIQRVLILGLGGGSLYRYFHESYPRADISVVEINQDVIDVAKTYFELPPTSAHCKIIHADALEFLNETELTYDLIISDIYSTRHLPEILKSPPYYQACLERLKPEGLLTVNLVVEDDVELRDTAKIVKEVFNKRTLLHPVKNYHNSLIFGKNCVDFFKQLEQHQTQGDLVDVKFDFDVGYYTEDLTPRADRRRSLFEKIFKP